MPWLEPINLHGQFAALVPLRSEHREALIESAQDGELWKLWYTVVPKPEEMSVEIDRRLELFKQGSMLPFTVLDSASRPVGMTTYMNVDSINHRVEIGSTWYAQSVQRTALNTECKLLLLEHAFEKMNCISVEFRTSSFNHVSRRAIERLGARLDGILRNYQRHSDGTLRDTCSYSIIQSEWPSVKTHLQYQLLRSR